MIWIADHAESRILFFDLTFLPLIEAIAPCVRTIRTFVALTGRAHMPASTRLKNLVCYEDLLGVEDDDFEWPEFDENTAASLCYTSGTTGYPKGVLYSHRSTVLHMSPADRLAIQSKQGRAVFGIELKTVGGDGRELPRDGRTPGELP